MQSIACATCGNLFRGQWQRVTAALLDAAEDLVWPIQLGQEASGVHALAVTMPVLSPASDRLAAYHSVIANRV